MCCTNCPVQGDPAEAAALLTNYALDSLAASREFVATCGISVGMRATINTGPVVGAVLGESKA